MYYRYLIYFTWFFSFTSLLKAQENIIYPEDAGIIDVTQPPYNADPTGNKDATKAIQQALNDYISSNRTIYLPDGIYLVSNTLIWGPSDQFGCGKCQKRTHLQGQSRDGTVIKLKNHAASYQDIYNGRPVILTGYEPAQRFRNSIWNLTINTGEGNPGAIGIQYITSNQGSVRNVCIISEDQKGLIGLDIAYTDEIGPGLVYNLEVDGFDYGVLSKSLNSMTFEKLILKNQNICGLKNEKHVLAIRNLVSINKVPAINNSGVMTIIDANCFGGETVSAISNTGTLYARNVKARGYDKTIISGNSVKRSIKLNYVKEFISKKPAQLFTSPESSLNLPIKDIPDVKWEHDFSKWGNPLKYGAVGDGINNDTKAVQRAIDDSSKTTVYFPGGYSFHVPDTLYIRGNINRLIFCGGRIQEPQLVFREGNASKVILERFDNLYYEGSIRHDADRDLVLSGTTAIDVLPGVGNGNLFLVDVNAGDIHINKNQNCWARQVNTENNIYPQNHINTINNGGFLWLLGLKTENWGTKIWTKNNGETEVLGAWIYANGTGKKTKPIFLVDNAFASFSGIAMISYSGYPFKYFVKEIRNRKIKRLPVKKIGNNLGLYSGFDKNSTGRF